MSILQIQNLTKTYDNKHFVLHGLNLTVEEGEFIAIVGSSGAGKSTLMRCINRMVEPTSGEIIFDGQNIEKAQGRNLRKIRSKIGMIFQHYNLISGTNVKNNVLHGRLSETPLYRSFLGLYSKEDKCEAERLLSAVGLSKQMYQKAGTLSGGQMQRVGICRALMQKPKLLLADEPIASLDPASAHKVLGYMKEATSKRGLSGAQEGGSAVLEPLSCIVNLHQVEFAMIYATRIIGMKNGNIVFDGKPEDLTDEVVAYIYNDDNEQSDTHSGNRANVSHICSTQAESKKGDTTSFPHAQKNSPLVSEPFASAPVSPYSVLVNCLMRVKRVNALYSGRIAAASAFAVVLAAFMYLRVSPINIFASFPSFFRFLQNNFLPPNFVGIATQMPTVLQTLHFAIVGTYISAIVAFLFGILMARELNPNPILRGSIRFFVSFIRNVPLVVWATVLIFIFGIGSMLGVVTLVMATLGFLARSYADTIDDIAGTKLEALRAGGASYWQVLFHGLIPEFVPAWVNWTLFSFEINIRASAVLGMVGAGGFGLLIQTNLNLRSYRRAMAFILILVAMVLVIEFLVNIIRKLLEVWRKTNIPPKLERICTIAIAILLIRIFFMSSRTLGLDFSLFASRFRDNAANVVTNLLAFNPSILPVVFYELFISILIGICALALGALVSMVLALLSAGNITPFKPIGWVIKAAVSILRAIPSLVIVLMTVASLGLGRTGAVVGLMFSSIGYLTRAFISSIEEQDFAIIETMRAMGATRAQVIVHGILPNVFRAFVSWVSIRLESNIADSVSIGIVGAGGVGMLIARAERHLNFPDLTTIIVVVIIAMFFVEMITSRIRKWV